MSTPTETPVVPAGATPGTGPVPTAPAPAGGAPVATETPSPGTPDPHGLPQLLADGTMVSGRVGVAAPETSAPSTDSPSQPTEPSGTTNIEAQPAEGDDSATGDRPEISSLPQWAQDLIKNTRNENMRTRVEAKKQAAEEAAVEARKSMAQEIGRALGIIDPDTSDEAQLSPEDLQSLLTNERTSTQMARTELAVFKAASSSGGALNASALLDSRSFLDAVKDLDPGDTEAINAAIVAAVQANPWLAVEKTPATTETAPVAETVAPVLPSTASPLAPPSGGSFAGGPGAQPQDVTTMSIDDFRKTLRPTPPQSQ